MEHRPDCYTRERCTCALVATMDGVREYAEGYPVELEMRDGRLAVSATNEGGHNGTAVDLVDIIEWVRAHRPELLR